MNTGCRKAVCDVNASREINTQLNHRTTAIQQPCKWSDRPTL